MTSKARDAQVNQYVWETISVIITTIFHRHFYTTIFDIAFYNARHYCFAYPIIICNMACNIDIFGHRSNSGMVNPS